MHRRVFIMLMFVVDCVNWLCNTEGEGLESEREGDGGTEGEGGEEEGADEQAPNQGIEPTKNKKLCCLYMLQCLSIIGNIPLT